MSDQDSGTKRYQYNAFISYSRTDEKHAVWLQRKLETYRIPNAIRKESGGRLPKNLRPVFRDKTDIGVGGLEQSLRQELTDSRFLIIVCSPHSAQSKWVNREVIHFQEMGRHDRIIPFIVEGTPDTDDVSVQCYPPALGRDVLGTSVPELGREQAFIKIVAAILSLKFDQLWDRHRRRQRRRRLTYGASAAIFCIAAAVGGFFTWDFYRTKTTYYADYVERWSIPEGIYPLTEEQVSRRNSHYRFEHSRGLLRLILHANSAGTPVPHLEAEYAYRPMLMALSYDESGALVTRDIKDRDGKVLVRQQIQRTQGDEKYFIDLRHEATGTGLAMTGSHSTTLFGVFSQNYDSHLFNPIRDPKFKSSISRLAILSDIDGFTVEEKYLRDSYNTPVPNADGLFGIKHTRDSAGRIARITYLDAAGQPVAVLGRVAGKRFRYDNAGNLLEMAFVDMEGQPASGLNGLTGWAATYDERGNLVRLTYTDVDGRPKFVPRSYAIRGMDGRTVLLLGSCAILTRAYDHRGNIIEESYFGANERPVLLDRGYARVTRLYDDEGNVTEEAYYGVDDRPALHRDGYARVTMAYDESGRIIELAYFGARGRPILHREGYAKIAAAYDELSNVIELAYFGVDGQPALSKAGYARRIAKFDARSNWIEEAYFGVDDEPVLHRSGFSRRTAAYDAHGNRTEEAYFGVDDEPVLHRNGYAKWSARYDERGNEIESAYFGIDGKPVSVNGHAKMTVSYDERGNMIERAWFGVDGKPVLGSNGFARLTTAYDARGRRIEDAYFGVDGEPVIMSNGYHRVERQYSSIGELLNETYFDTAGNEIPADQISAGR